MRPVELDESAVKVGQSAESMERRALALICLPVVSADATRVCERSTCPLPYGCWQDRPSPYALYGDDRWCDRCIAYSALNGTLPRPETLLELRREATAELAP